MKRIVCFCIILAAAVLQNCPASALEFGVDLPINSKYMWRGLELNEDPVFQPDVWISHKGFTLTVWGNLELTDIYNGDNENGERGDFTEVDYIFQYDGSYNKFNYSVGYIYYDFPHTSFENTQEIFVGLGYDTLLSPTITVYRDIDEVDGWYVTFGVSHEIELEKLLNSTLMLGATIGYSSENHSKFYYGTDNNIFSDALFTVELKLPVTKQIAIIPAVNYSILIDGTNRGKGLNKRDDTFWAGINIAFDFDMGQN